MIKVLHRWQGYFPKEKFLCDLGCGYGGQLKVLRECGFNKIIGCEASPLRAEVARRAFGLNVLDGTFGDPSVQTTLRELAPLGLIYANNVLEHVYNPAEVIRLCAGLQEEGDKLVIAVPNQIGEPTWCVLLYFLHLNAAILCKFLRFRNYCRFTDTRYATDINKHIYTPFLFGI